MADSQNSTSTKCFSGIVRRLLCTGSLPTHPTDSDHLPEIEKNEFKFPPRKTQGQAPGTPGVVARLMGLDSMPDVTWVPNVSINNMRSRSVSHVDYFPRFDLMQESQHRRVRTSVSFREIPTSLGPQNQDFFVVCFDKGDENLKMMAKTDHVVGFQEMKKVGRSTKATSGNIGEKIAVKKKENIQQNNKKNDEPKRKSSRSDHVLSHKKLNDVYVRSSSRLKMKSPEKAANIGKDVSARKKHAKKKEIRSRAQKGLPECSSVDSSPDSFSSTSGNSGAMGLNPRKKYSTPKLEKPDYPRFRMSNVDDDLEERAMNLIKSTERLMKSIEVDFYIKKLDEVCRLTEEDTKGSYSNLPWIISGDQYIKFEDVEDICLDFEQQILEMLINQVVGELCR